MTKRRVLWALLVLTFSQWAALGVCLCLPMLRTETAVTVSNSVVVSMTTGTVPTAFWRVQRPLFYEAHVTTLAAAVVWTAGRAAGRDDRPT